MYKGIETQIEKALIDLSYDVEITFCGSLDNKIHFTISGKQYDSQQAAKFMHTRGLATVDQAISDPEDKDFVCWYMVA